MVRFPRRRPALSALVLASMMVSTVMAKPSAFEEKASAITASLRSGDAAKIDVACTEIDILFQSNPREAYSAFKQSWLNALLDARRYDFVAKTAWTATLAASANADAMQSLLSTRARALLKAKKPDEALSAARSAFNVGPMVETTKTLQLLHDCLRAAKGGEAEKATSQLKREQLDGAKASKDSPKISPILLAIPLKTNGIEEKIKDLDPAPATYTLSRGNLLLLSGDTKKAREAFEAYMSETDKTNLLPFHENVARAIRAEDGTIGRANAYLLSLTESQLKSEPSLP